MFGEETPGNNKPWLIKRIAWRLQALAEGDLSERARRRAAALVHEADLRLSAPPAGLTPSDPATPLRWPLHPRSGARKCIPSARMRLGAFWRPSQTIGWPRSTGWR